MDAVEELWPLVIRLETDFARPDTDLLRLTAEARLSFATALGHVLHEEQLPLVTHWTERAWNAASHLNDDGLTSRVLRVQGNELRKQGRVRTALQLLHQALKLAPTPADQAASLALLARCSAEAGHRATFRRALAKVHRLLDQIEYTALVNPYTLREIHLRGIVRMRLPKEIGRLLDRLEDSDGSWVTPQWRVLMRVTQGHAALVAKDLDQALHDLGIAVSWARQQHLPHQLQRIQRLAALAPDTPDTEQLRHASASSMAALSPPPLG